MKRVLSFLLFLCMVTAMLPGRVSAQETQTSLDNGDMTVSGTNGFGVLLSNEIAESQAEADAYQAGYAVTDLTFNGNVAAVTYDAMEEATLVVAVYTENGLQMLASGRTTVSPDETETTVTIDGTMPEYFYATAFLLDPCDYVPLCEEYSTPMYTREMQALLDSTVDDYDAERVYNLDDDNTTNFAVFAEDTIVIREQAGVNTVASADDENMVYVIENADATVTSLVAGDVLAYPYGEDDILIVKVASITVDGTTATITGAPLEMNEAFAAVKIEAATSELSVDPDYRAEGFSRLNAPAQSRSWDSGIEIGQSFTYAFDVWGQDVGSGGSVKITGSLTIGITAAVNVYSTDSYTRVETKLDFFQHYMVAAEGKGAFEANTPFEIFTLSPFPGVTVTVKPKLMLEFSAAVALDYGYTSSMGSYINYDGNQWTTQTIRENPKPEFDVRFEGTVFLGISLSPAVELLKGKLAKVELEAKLGVELKGTQSLVDWERDPSSQHECDVCIDFDLSFVCSMEPSITLVNNPKLSMKTKLVEIKFKFLDAYWCKDRDEFHLGTCPYLSYRVTMGVLDENNRPLPNMSIRLSDGSVHNTGNAGAVAVYLPNGTYTASLLSSALTASTKFTVADDSRSVLLSAEEAEPDFGLPGDVSSESVTDYGPDIDSGTYGKNVSWVLRGDGTLVFSGTGTMKGIDAAYEYQPWYNCRDSITNVEIMEGITSIGSDAFYGHSKIVSVSIPDTVTVIGDSAFEGCSSLAEISIPASVSNISNAFSLCNSLQAIRVSEDNPYYCNDEAGILYNKAKTTLVCAPGGISGNVVIPDSVTFINGYAFKGCRNLTGVTIPDGVTSILAETFYWCSSLTEVLIPDGVNEIGYRAFYDCDNLMEITIPEGVTRIASNAFYSCDNLSIIIIPDSVTYLGDGVFGRCVSLTSVVLSSNLTDIPYGMFYGCTKLSDITIPKSITNIADTAFAFCTSLTKITFLGDAPALAANVFALITTTAYYPAGNDTWTSDVMQDYGGTLTWVPYTPDDGIALSEAAEVVPVTQPASFTDDLVIGEQPSDGMTPDAIFGGDYTTEVVENSYILKTATFSGLVPNEEYVMLALKSIETGDILAADNLLGILQGTAGADGTLRFQYIQRVNTDVSYVIACGASNKNLQNATITFPEITANGELQAVIPTVVYDGKVLAEGIDYEITGTVDFTAGGTYTCQIRGIHNYTGTVTCTYTVAEVTVVLGDVNGDEEIDILDANLVVAWYNEIRELEDDQLLAADVNGDGEVDIMDANMIVAYYNEVIDSFPAKK